MIETDAIVGKDIAVYFKGDETARICATAKEVQFLGDPIAIGNTCGDNITRYIDRLDQRGISLQIEGIVSSDAFTSKHIRPDCSSFIDQASIVVPGLFVLEGDFIMMGVGLSGEEGAPVEIQATLQSSGEWSAWDAKDLGAVTDGKADKRDSAWSALGQSTFYADFTSQTYYKAG